MFKVIVLCAQDELNPLGWCVCAQSAKGIQLHEISTQQGHKTL